MGRLQSIVFLKTFRISFGELVEQVRILRIGIGAIWKFDKFWAGPPTINKKRKTDNNQLVSDILMLCNDKFNNVPYSCFLPLFPDDFFRMDIRNRNTGKLSMNGHELSIAVSFFFSDRFGCWKMKKDNYWETQSKHYSDIDKKISYLSRLCFFLE